MGLPLVLIRTNKYLLVLMWLLIKLHFPGIIHMNDELFDINI